MALYQFDIKEILMHTETVAAESYEVAFDIVSELYKNEEIVLGAEHHTSTNITASVANPNYATMIDDIHFLEYATKTAHKNIAHLTFEELVTLAFGDLENGKRMFEEGYSQCLFQN